MTLVPTNPAIKKIAGANLVLGIATTALAGVLWGPRGTLGAGAGAILACADFLFLAHLGSKAVAAVRTGGSAWGLGLGLFAKMTGLFALVFVTSYKFALQFAEQPLLISFGGYMRARRGDEDVHFAFQHVIGRRAIVPFAEDDLAGFEAALYNRPFIQLKERARNPFEYR